MKQIKVLLLSIAVTVLSFLAIDAGAETITAANIESITASQQHTEYVWIDGDWFIVTYDDDGKIMGMEPMGE